LRALTGFMIASVIILFQALANAVCLMLLWDYMKDEYSAFITGSGIAGILMNVIKYILLLIFKDDSEYFYVSYSF
jgi:hypothetical protein